jgi:hypothetical protein
MALASGNGIPAFIRTVPAEFLQVCINLGTETILLPASHFMSAGS